MDTTEDMLVQRAVGQLEALLATDLEIEIEVETRSDGSAGLGAATQLIIRSPISSVTYTCEVKANLRLAMLGPLLPRFRRLQRDRPRLLVTTRITAELGASLRKARVEYIDASGNAYLRQPAVYVLIEGRKDASVSTATTTRTLTATKLRVVYALLRAKQLRSADFRSIAAAADVSLGTVSNAVGTLETQGYLRRRRDGLEIIDFEALLARWELGYADQLRPKLEVARLSLGRKRSIEEVLGAATPNRGTGLVGGELGAAYLTGHIRATSAVLHSSASIREVMTAFRAGPAPDGEITVLRPLSPAAPFGPPREGLGLADPLLIRAELLLTRDERLAETARLILDTIIVPRERG